jgi:hypothetical protein
MKRHSMAALLVTIVVSIACSAQTQRDTLPAHPKPKRLEDVKAGMRFQEDVVAGLGADYRLTKITDMQWEAQSANEDGEIDVKDGIVISAGILLPTGTGDAASFIQELLKGFYLKTRPATDDTGSLLGVRNSDAEIQVVTNPLIPDLQRISFTFSDGTGYTIIVIKNEKSNRPPLVQLEKFWR